MTAEILGWMFVAWLASGCAYVTWWNICRLHGHGRLQDRDHPVTPQDWRRH